MTSARLIELPRNRDARGDLTFIENHRHVPFVIRRVFYLYAVPADASRAGHALIACEQFVVAVAGSFDVIVNEGVSDSRFRLDHPAIGLYIPALCWRSLERFSANAVCLVLASELYDKDAYIDTFDEFQKAVKSGLQGLST